MYKFIKECRKEYLVNEEYIKKIEEFFNIKLPFILKEFYCKYNGAKINLCIFYIDDYKYEISEISPLKYGKCCVEKLINARKDHNIPFNMIPFGNTRGGDYYYWDILTKNVYLFYHEDIENPVYICENIEEMFNIMSKNLN